MSDKNDRYQRLASEARARIKEVGLAQLPLELKREPAPLLIDVREADEFAADAIPGAIHVSRGMLEQRIEELAPDLGTPIVCYCSGGNRSALAVESLQRMGYRKARSFAEGFRAWNQAGLASRGRLAQSSPSEGS